MTPASPRLLVQNAGFGAPFGDFLGSNFWHFGDIFINQGDEDEIWDTPSGLCQVATDSPIIYICIEVCRLLEVQACLSGSFRCMDIDFISHRLWLIKTLTECEFICWWFLITSIIHESSCVGWLGRPFSCICFIWRRLNDLIFPGGSCDIVLWWSTVFLLTLIYLWWHDLMLSFVGLWSSRP